jgi:hypothetical protein
MITRCVDIALIDRDVSKKGERIKKHEQHRHERRNAQLRACGSRFKRQGRNGTCRPLLCIDCSRLASSLREQVSGRLFYLAKYDT